MTLQIINVPNGDGTVSSYFLNKNEEFIARVPKRCTIGIRDVPAGDYPITEMHICTSFISIMIEGWSHSLTAGDQKWFEISIIKKDKLI